MFRAALCLSWIAVVIVAGVGQASAAPYRVIDPGIGASPPSLGKQDEDALSKTADIDITVASRESAATYWAVDLGNGASPPSSGKEHEDVLAETAEMNISTDETNDPYELANRRRFKSHLALHRHLIDPVERAYIRIVPEPLRLGMHNFLANLETPVILVNDVFQGDIHRAGGTFARFVINTTVGLGGILDIAEKVDIHYRDNDFGQTLAHYGASDYPYLLVPVIGPSNPRDLAGKVVDIFLNPLHYLAIPGGILTSASRTGLHELDKRSEDAGELDELSRMVSDPYATERAQARARRSAEINGTPGTALARVADRGDACSVIGRERAEEAAFRGFDKNVQNQVLALTYSDCDAWERQH